MSSVSGLKQRGQGYVLLHIVGVGLTGGGDLSSLRGAGFPVGVLEQSVGWGRDEWGVTRLVFFALAFLTTFAVPPCSFPASSTSSAGTFFPFLAFFAVGFVAFSSAFDGPHFRTLGVALGAAGGAVSAVAALALRLGGIA